MRFDWGGGGGGAFFGPPFYSLKNGSGFIKSGRVLGEIAKKNSP